MGEQRPKSLAISREPESHTLHLPPPNGGGDKGDKAQKPQHVTTGFWFSPFPRSLQRGKAGMGEQRLKRLAISREPESHTLHLPPQTGAGIRAIKHNSHNT
ncbi:hypothetical protein ASE93_20605 [Serratia sp. Leaf50]|nr:hypothetical protein ASE93_20605 [Serratia sp. Leaf50]